MEKTIASLTNEELMTDLIECISLEGEAKARAKPIREELQRRQVSSGETNVDFEGWQFNLKREPFSLSWVMRQYGYERKDIPNECFEEQIEIVASPEKVIAWLQREGFEVTPTYTLSVNRKKVK